MPIYFFHRADRNIFDQLGTELPDLQAARIAAITFLGEILKDEPSEFWSTGTLSVDVTGEGGAILVSLNVSAAQS